jgi:hypothetical protein
MCVNLNRDNISFRNFQSTVMPRTVSILTATLLLLALAPMPYGYYVFLRLIATGVFVWAAVVSKERHQAGLALTFTLLVVLFNPVMKVPLPRELWAFIDLVIAVFLLVVSGRLAINQPSKS